ncbi:MAG TPA: DUF1858 domain-containing protein [Firmicutes bacterium]|nr:DUF1858 domain-containing protein [Bacillota bacterium]
MRITKETSIFDALQSHPQARDVFAEFGMDCLGCMGVGESIESGARMHGVDVDLLVERLNQLLLDTE